MSDIDPVEVKAALVTELQSMAPDQRESALAASALTLAQRLDGTTSARDSASLARELRMTLDALHDRATIDVEAYADDITEFKRRTIQRRQAAGAYPQRAS